MKRSSEAEIQTKRRKRRLEDLLATRTPSTDHLTGDSRALLNQAVFQLIDHHQDLNQLLKEATIVHDKTGSEDVEISNSGPATAESFSLNPTVLSCVNYLKHSVSQNRSGTGQVSTRSCVEGIKATLRVSGTSATILLTQEQRKQVQSLLTAVQALQKDQSFSRSHFIKCLTTEVALPLELVWCLHQTAGIPLSSYLACNVGKPKAMSTFVQSVVQAYFCGSKEDRLVRRDIITGILGSLISYAYTEKRGKAEEASAKGLRKASVVLLDKIIMGLIVREEGLVGDEDTRLKLGEVLYHHGNISQDALQQFCIRQLNAAFAHNPTSSVWEVVSAQSRWTYSSLPVHIKDLYTQILVLLTPEDVTQQLEYVMDKEQACLIDKLISQSLESNNCPHLLVAFLLARQAGQEGPHVFPPYSQWFQHNFGGSSSPHVASVRTFSCLMRLLSDMVPHETPQCLKVHVLHPPHVLPRYRAQLSDYISLAKTRLADLGESIEESSIYEDGSTDRQGKTDRSLQAVNDVERAMAQFEKTGKVPANVIEARSEKIPVNMYTAYTEGCRREAAQLLEGVFEGDEQEELFEPQDQLRHSLDKFPAAVVTYIQTASTTTANNAEVTPLLSVISEKLTLVLETLPGQSSRPEVVELDISHPQLDSSLLKVVDLLLNTFCKTVAASSAIISEKPDIAASSTTDWAAQFVSMLSRHTALLPALHVCLWHLISKQGPHLDLHHVHGLAAFLLHLGSQQTLFPKVQFLYLVPRLLGSDVGSPGSKPGCGVTMDTQDFFRRSRDEVKAEDWQILMAAAQIYHSEFFKQILSRETQKFSLKDWMKLELQVNPMQDVLCQIARHEYHRWVLHYFLPLPAQEGGCVGSYTQAAEDMVHSLLDNFSRLCMSLPAEYLYGVSPQERLSSKALSAVAGFINTLLRNHVGQSSCLPFDVTSYLTRGALKVVTSHSAGSDGEKWLEQLMTASPLLKTSLLAWWTQLRPLVSHMCCGSKEGQLPASVRRVDAFSQWTTSVLDDQNRAGAIFGIIGDVRSDTRLVAAALFHRLNTKCRSHTVDPSSTAKVMKGIQELGETVGEKVASCLLLMIMLHLSAVDFSSQEPKPANSPWVKLAQSLLNTYPGSLEVFTEDTENPSTQPRLCPDRMYQLVPIMFLRTLVACPVDILQNPRFLPTALSMHLKVNGLYQSVGGEEVWGGAKAMYRGQILTLDLMGQITRILMHCIPQCSEESLRQLDMDVLAECDPDIQHQVKKRL
ncbi:hypothetical protein Bbelb_030630 [Branchiostoma belcheri]|nr:hypothetical protein Bbelb_030630 [Branchiostoma belcheri]